MPKTYKPMSVGVIPFDANVEMEQRHCSKCAIDRMTCPVAAPAIQAAINEGLDASEAIIPFHGVEKKVFQDFNHTLWLIRKNWLSPLWINQWYASFLLPFLGFWSTSKVSKNGITDTGRAAMASRCNGSGGEAAFTSIGQGTGTTAFAAGNTAMETGKKADGTGDSGVHALATASVTVSRVTTTVTNDTAQLVGTVAETATMAITESGVFNADTNGVMLARQTFTAINVVNGDSIQFTWKIKAA